MNCGLILFLLEKSMFCASTTSFLLETICYANVSPPNFHFPLLVMKMELGLRSRWAMRTSLCKNIKPSATSRRCIYISISEEQCS